MYKIWDKIKVSSKNEDTEGNDFLMYSTVQGISHDVDWKTKYIIGLNQIEEALMTKCTPAEISKYFAKWK